MARENSGLQIALIIVVVLTIGLGVGMFLFYSKAKDLDVKLKTAQQEASKAQAEARDRQGEITELKRILGVADTEKVAALTEQFTKDMQSWAGTFPEKSRYYRPALEYMFTTLKTTNGSLADAKKEIADWKDKFEQREASKDVEIKRHQDSAKKAGDDLATEREKFKADIAKVNKTQSDILAEKEDTRKNAEEVMSKADEKVKVAGTEVTKLAMQVKDLRGKLNDVIKDIPDTVDGEIRWVNQAAKTVWLDIGRADGLAPQTTFSVYPGDTLDLKKAVKKGSVEVVQILSDHLSEARILDDSATNPIIPGDKIETPVWKPGERRHFALAGTMDLNGDGRDDSRTVRNLITLNGGIIDAEIDAQNARRVGEITTGTRYIVVGEPPEVRGNPAASTEMMNQYSKLLGDARKMGVEEIKVGELVNRMGWKGQARVVSLGAGSNIAPPAIGSPGYRPVAPQQFRPRQPGGNGTTAY